MTSGEIRKKFLVFFSDQGHTVVPSSSLIPDDPSVLLTTAGMQQFKQYYDELDSETTVHPLLGKPVGKNAVSIQKCFRTSDIDEVGDERHLTFFEMLGNFSFGGYGKAEAIRYAYEFIIEVMRLSIDYVTVFDPREVPDGDWRKRVPEDEESYSVWLSLGVPESKIKRVGIDNFWGPTGSEGPCGPTTEIYVDGIEIWNIVFNQFRCDAEKKLTPLSKLGVDTGMGLERLAMVSESVPTIFETDLFTPLMEFLPAEISKQTKRIIADHARGIAFLVCDGVRPSNKEVGYVLRRLMRRVIAYDEAVVERMFFEIVVQYRNSYQSLDARVITDVFTEERGRFTKTLGRGLRELEYLTIIDAPSAFKLFESYGLPYEIIKERSGDRGSGLAREAFDEEFKKHQEISRAGVEKKFGGHGFVLNTGELKAKDEGEKRRVLRLHTATHLLQAALREVLGNEVRQAGSDITDERARFDFTFEHKLMNEEIEKIEAIVNRVIKENLPVKKVILPKSEAEKTGALYFLKGKYPDPVSVYYVGEDIENAFSKEFCGGPHVARTGEIGTFKILKEKAVSAGVRRIRATVAP